MVTAPRQLSPRWTLVLALTAIAAIRLTAAALVPLTDDEAYYSLWAGHLQLGYFDHPPMIAWFIRAGQEIAGRTPLGVRLLPTAGLAAASLLISDLARTTGLPPDAATRAALWFNGALLIALGGALAVPDSPTILFWTAALACAGRAVRPRAAAGWWLAAGVAGGLAALSKYSGLFLAPGILLWLASTQRGRRALASPRPWLAGLAGTLVFALNLAWNAEHGWVTFAKQFGRVAVHQLAPWHLAELLAAQFVLANPFIALLAARGAAATVGGRRRIQPGALMAAATSAPFAVYLLIHSLHDPVQGQWPAPLYPSLAILAAAAATGIDGPRRRRADVAVGVTAAVAAGAGLLHLLSPATDWLGPRDPVAMLRGWPRFADQVRRRRLGAGAGWIGTFSYQTKAQLQLQLGPAAAVVQLDDRDRYGPADSSWGARLTRPGLVVETERRSDPARLAGCFALVRPAGTLWRGDAAGERYRVFIVAVPRGDLLRKGC